MQFSQSGEIRVISVSGGQRVKRGDVLARVRDAEVVAAIARQKIVAENTLEIDNAEKQLELAVYRFEQLKAGKTFSPAEFEELRISAEVAKIQRDQAKVNLEAQKIALDQLLGQAERYRLEAPFDGVIEEVMVEVGQGVTENEKVLRIVNTETLWLDAYATTSETIRLGLKENSPAWVLVELADSPRLVKGRVLYVSPVADAVSQTRRVRVEITNREDWPAGTQARVRFTEPSGEWNKYESGGGTRAKTARSFEVQPQPWIIEHPEFVFGSNFTGSDSK
jgi:multidrug efflux system membrane fusion protein